MLNPGLKICECRSRKGWTQAELAARAGIAQANLSNIEKGKRDLTVSMLVRLAAALEIRPAQLIEEKIPAQTFRLTRRQIETLAKAVVDPNAKVRPGTWPLKICRKASDSANCARPRSSSWTRSSSLLTGPRRRWWRWRGRSYPGPRTPAR